MRLRQLIVGLTLLLVACASNTPAPGVVEFNKTPCDQMVVDYKRALFKRHSKIYWYDMGEQVTPTYGQLYNQLYLWKEKGYRVKAELWPGWSECGTPLYSRK